jgi:hypothetical protein
MVPVSPSPRKRDVRARRTPQGRSGIRSRAPPVHKPLSVVLLSVPQVAKDADAVKQLEHLGLCGQLCAHRAVLEDVLLPRGRQVFAMRISGCASARWRAARSMPSRKGPVNSQGQPPSVRPGAWRARARSSSVRRVERCTFIGSPRDSAYALRPRLADIHLAPKHRWHCGALAREVRAPRQLLDGPGLGRQPDSQGTHDRGK